MRHRWTFVTSHGAVLVITARERAVTAQSIAFRLGLGVRSVQRILSELEAAGYLSKHKEGRSNVYDVDLAKPMRHPGLEELRVGDVFAAYLHYPSGMETSQGHAEKIAATR